MRAEHLPRDETSVLVILIIMALLGICLSSAHAGLVILYANAALLSRKSTVVYGILLFLPMLSVIAALFVARAGYRHLLSSATDVRKANAGEFFEGVSSELCGQMNVNREVKVMCLNDSAPASNDYPCSPLAFALSPRRPIVLLPANMWNLALSACRGDVLLAKELVRLVLAHEIAHIRNGDVLYVPFLSIISGLLIWAFIVIMALSWLFGRLKADATLTILEPRLTSIMFSGFIFLALLIRFTMARREQLADHTAAQFLPPDCLKQLTEQPSADQLSPLEQFLVSICSISPCSRSVMGFSIRGPADRFWDWVAYRIGMNSVRMFREKLRARFQEIRLRERQHWIRERWFRFVTVIMAAFLGAFLFGIFEAAILQDFELFWVEQNPHGQTHLRQSFLKAISGWSQLQSGNLLMKIDHSLGPFSIGLVMAIIFAMVMRRRWAANRPFQEGMMFQIAGWTAFMCFCFLFIRGFWVIAPIPTVPNFLFMRPNPLMVCFWVVVLNISYGIWTAWRAMGNNDRHGPQGRH